MLDALQATGLARTVGESLLLTGWLSAAHVLGFTLVMGGGLVTNLRLAGAVLGQVDARDVARPANRIIALGLAISLGTGFLLFAPRAADAAQNGTFRLKMLLLLTAVAFHFAVQQRVAYRVGERASARLTGVVGFALWLGLAVAACWFILFE